MANANTIHYILHLVQSIELLLLDVFYLFIYFTNILKFKSNIYVLIFVSRTRLPLHQMAININKNDISYMYIVALGWLIKSSL